MDFLDPAKRRSHTIRLFIGYILIAIAVALASLILLFQSYGYDLDRHTGQVIQNGLLFVSTKPESAAIYLNGTLDKSHSDAKLTIPAGQYLLELKRDGYRTWKRSFSLDGGSIERFVYPLLFPENIKTTDVQLYSSAPAFSSQSIDNRWLLVQQTGILSIFDVYDLNNSSAPPSVLSVPVGIFNAEGPSHKLTAVDWASDNKHVLIKHDFGTGIEFVMVDRENAASAYNVTKTVGTASTNITLLDKRFDKLMVHDQASQVLQSFDAKTSQLTQLLTRVQTYKTHGDKQIIYTTDNGIPAGKISVKLWDGSSSYEMQSFKNGSDLILDITQYSGDWYMTVASRTDDIVYVYKNPQDLIKLSTPKPLIPISVLKIDSTAFLSFSENARFIAAQNGSKFAVYDIETDRRYYYDLGKTIDPALKANWMDGYRLILTLDGKTEVFDYDGINQRTLSPAYEGNNIFFNRDYTSLYNIAPSVGVPGRAALTRTELKL